MSAGLPRSPRIVATYCPRCDASISNAHATDASCERCGAGRPVEGWPTDPLIGDAFDRDYRVLRRLGSGGFGVVYLAENREFGAKRALKILHSRYVHDDRVLRRFKREAKALYRLQSPYTVRVERWGRSEEGHYYLVMEFAEGQTLREILDESGTLGEQRAIAVVRQIAVALADAHSLEILHRDLKPANIIVRQHPHEGERIVVLDFGISKILSDGTSDNRSGVVGTPLYMAPEIWKPDTGTVDIRADLWSLGLILYECLVGALPFDTTSSQPLSVAYQACALTPESVREALEGAGASDAAMELVVALLRTDPSARFQAPSDVLRAIDGSFSSGVSGATRLDVGARPSSPEATADALARTTADSAGEETASSPPRPTPRGPASAVRTTSGSLSSDDFTNEGFTFGGAPDDVSTALGNRGSGAALIIVFILLAGLGTLGAMFREELSALIGRPSADAGVHTDAEPVPDGPPERVTGPDGVESRRVAASLWTRGDEALSDAIPSQVVISAFYLDEQPITRAAWNACVEAGRCNDGAVNRSPDCPGGEAADALTCVTWDGARRYCEAQGRRLPSEAEWEAAASAWLSATEVAEWTADWYASDWYAVAPIESPPGPMYGLERVVRGGLTDGGSLRGPAERHHAAPDSQYADLGFRCATDGN